MSEYEVFPNPPIVEAILTFSYPMLTDLEDLAKKFHSAVEDNYPTFSPFHPEPSVPAKEPPSVRLISADGLNVISIGRRGFSYHRLRPYIAWDDFKGRARDAWDCFSRFSEPEEISGLALRYINRIDLPLGQDWARYLLMRPEIPDAIDTGIQQYLMVLHLQDLGVPATGTVAQVCEATPDPRVIALLLDITVRTPPEARFFAQDAESVWEMIHRLRTYKDRLFFEGITEKTKDFFR